MAPNLLQIVIFKILLSTITCNYVYQYPTSQYPQQSYTPYPTPQTYPKQTFPDYKTYPNYQPYQAQANFVYPKPETTPPCSTPKPLIPEPVLPIVPTPSLKEKPKTPGFDSNVLNNLAIALQLLIVSNIINNPPSETNPGSLLDNFPVMPCKEFENTPFKSIIDAMPDFQRMTPPNSKFLGETDVMSSFGNFGSFPKPRPNGLMSPYEAITSNSFSDRPKYNSMKDFQSPYSAMLAFDNNKDLFSMSDLFQN